MEQTALTPRDKWVIARLLGGFTQTELPTGMTARGEQIARQLMAVNYKDRDYLLKRNVTVQEYRDFGAIDPDTTIPTGGDPSKAWTIFHAKELKNLPPVSWLIPGEIPELGLTILYGESGAGKSFIGVDYALTVAQVKRVAYVPTEGFQGYGKRVAAWCEHHNKSEGDLFFFSGGVTLFEKEPFADLLADLKRLAPVLVVFDTLALAMAGGDENSSRDMGMVLANCRKIIRTTGASVVLVHHVGKAGTSERGSSALRGNADVMIRVSPADDLVYVECSKTKDEQPFAPRYIFMRPVADSLVPVPAEQYVRNDGALTPNQHKLLDLLSLEVNRDGVSLRDMSELASLSLGSVQRTLSNLLKKNLVHKPSSYAITEAGLAAIGKSESVRSKNTQPMNQSESKNLSDESSESSTTPLFSVDSDAFSDSVDSLDSSAKRTDSLRKRGSVRQHWQQ